MLLNLLGLLALGAFMYGRGGGDGRGGSGNGGRTAEISFQEFRNRLLAQGLVARLEVANGNLVKVRGCRGVGLGMDRWGGGREGEGGKHGRQSGEVGGRRRGETGWREGGW